MPLFRYFVVVGAALMAGLYVLAAHIDPQPLPPYFGQTAELPKSFYETPSELSARQTARSRPVESMPVESAPVAAAATDLPSAQSPSSPPPVTKLARKTSHPSRVRPSSERQMPERIRTVRGGDMMVPIRIE